MKKLLLSLLAGTILFSGCGNTEEKTPESSKTPAVQAEEKKEAMKEMTPEEKYYMLAQANLDYSIDIMKENIPSKEVFEKGEKTLSVDGTVNLAGTPAQSGTVDFTISTTATGDYSDTNNTKLAQTIDFSGKISEAMVTGDAKGSLELRVVDNSLFASLTSLEVNSPMVPKEQVEMMVGMFAGKWFGNTFEELNALQQGAQKINLQKFIAGTPMGVIMWEMIEDEQKNLKDYMEFVSFVEEKDGVMYFEVKQKTEKSTQMISVFTNAFGLPAEAQAKIQKNMEAQNGQTITVGYKASDATFITVKSPAINPNTKKEIEGKTNTLTFSDSEFSAEINSSKDDVIRIQAKDGKFSIGGDSKEKKDFTVVTGTYSDTAFTFEATNPDQAKEETQKKIMGTFAKTGNAWAGEITNTINPALVVKISNASYSKEKITLSLEVAMGEFTYGPINFKTTIKAVDSVSVEAPENAQPFEALTQIAGGQPAPAEAELEVVKTKTAE